jgi:hypothetical protein
LKGFEAAILAPSGTKPLTPDLSREVVAFIQGIERKMRFVELHMAVLDGIEWDRVESIGRQASGTNQRNHLTIRLADAALMIEHTEAVIDHVYAAFDGLMAAVVNMTDTMGRLINSRYAIGIHPRRASLLSLKNYCSAASPLFAVVNDPVHNDWLGKIRDLRGRCQHADVEHVLVTAEGPYSRRGQPLIPDSYCWRSPPIAMPIVDYSQQAAQAAEDTLLAVISAVIAAPSNPLV